jgi:hypothetical protein
VPADEWDAAWAAISSCYHGALKDGDGRYVHAADGNSVAMVIVGRAADGKDDAAAMKAQLDRQGQQAAEHYGTSWVKDVAGHEVLEFTDLYQQPNWYWVSGDEFVMVTGHDYDQGAAFVEVLAAQTL